MENSIGNVLRRIRTLSGFPSPSRHWLARRHHPKSLDGPNAPAHGSTPLDPESAQSAAVTAIPGVVFSGALDGHLRAYSSDRGQIIWDLDTDRPFETINGVRAKGGSIDGPGPVIAHGLLLTNSGYGVFAGTPGNVLLAFTAEPR